MATISIGIIHIFIFLVICGTSYSQENRVTCESIYKRAVDYFRIDRDYKKALKKLAAYKICSPDSTIRADKLIDSIYLEVNDQRDQAIYQKNLALQGQRVIALQKDSITMQYKRMVLLFARKELAEINLLPRAPINMERRKKLELLLPTLEPIRPNAIIDSIQALIDEIPSPDLRKLKLESDAHIVGFRQSNDGNVLFIVYETSIQVWDMRKIIPICTFEIRNMTEKSQSGKADWIDYSRNEDRLYLEIAYEHFASAILDSQVKYEGPDTDIKSTFWKYIIKGREKHIYSMTSDCVMSFRAISDFSELRNQYDDRISFRDPINIFFGQINFRKKEDVIPGFRDKSGDIAKIIEDSLRNDHLFLDKVMRNRADIFSWSGNSVARIQNVQVLATDFINGTSIYEILYDPAEALALAGPPAYCRIPILYQDSANYFFLSGKILCQLGHKCFEEDFVPAAVNYNKKLALLGSRLISFEGNKPTQIDRLNLYEQGIDSIAFLTSGDALIFFKINGDISILDWKTKKENTFLQLNNAKYKEVSGNGKYIYVITQDNSFEIWETKAFGEKGWAASSNSK